MDNNKYTTAKEIEAMINRVHRNKPTNLIDIVNWCAECEINMIKDFPWRIKVKDYKAEVKSNQVKQPCNVYRLIRVKSEISTKRPKLITEFTDNGAYIFLPSDCEVTTENGKDYVYLDYEAIPIHGETKLPLILKGHELACMYYCVKMLYYEDFLQNKINGQHWGVIERDLDNALVGAQTGTRYISDNEKKRIFHTIYNITQDIVNYKSM